MNHGWKMTDFVILISAKYPFNQPFVEFNLENIKPGIWNVMPVFDGDQM